MAPMDFAIALPVELTGYYRERGRLPLSPCGIDYYGWDASIQTCLAVLRFSAQRIHHLF